MKLRMLVWLVLLAGAAVVGAAPYYTAHQLRQAVQVGDANSLAQHVDFPKVREGFKTQLSDSLLRHVPDSAKSSAWASVGAAVANAAADQALGALVTPDGVMSLLSGRLPVALPSWGAENPPPTAPVPPPQDPQPKAQAKYLSWDQFQVRVPVGERWVRVLLSREGVLTWRVTQVSLPESAQAGQ